MSAIDSDSVMFSNKERHWLQSKNPIDDHIEIEKKLTVLWEALPLKEQEKYASDLYTIDGYDAYCKHQLLFEKEYLNRHMFVNLIIQEKIDNGWLKLTNESKLKYAQNARNERQILYASMDRNRSLYGNSYLNR